MFWKNRKMLVSAIVILGLSFFTPTSNAHFFWEKLPVFYALFGFAGCIVLIIISKTLGKFFIKRDENYYE
jgi:hypothetical protein